MVKVWVVWVASRVLTGLDRVMMPVRLGWIVVLSMIGTVMGSAESPTAKFSVPAARVKSVPLTPVPPVTE